MPEQPILRLFENDADYNTLADIIAASQAADRSPVSISAIDVKESMSRLPHFELNRDLVIAVMGGKPVGCGRVSWREEPGRRGYSLTGYVRPEFRKQSVGTAILGWLERRALAITEEQPTSYANYLEINATQFQIGLHALAKKAHYQVKESWVLMVRSSLDEISAGLLPAGLEVRPALPEHFSAIWHAMEEAYEPEGGPPPTGIIPNDFRNNANFQPELWQVAWDIRAGKVAGSVMTYINHAENKQLGILRGYTEGISTAPAWQRRGVAKALIARSLQAQRHAGMTESALICSGEKPANYRLYESCGFKEVKRDTVYVKALG